nr:MAG TPA: hypothetical protein [Caudoviricetes sp.]
MKPSNPCARTCCGCGIWKASRRKKWSRRCTSAAAPTTARSWKCFPRWRWKRPGGGCCNPLRQRFALPPLPKGRGLGLAAEAKCFKYFSAPCCGSLRDRGKVSRWRRSGHIAETRCRAASGDGNTRRSCGPKW